MTTRRSDDADERPETGTPDSGESSRPRLRPTEAPGGETSGLRAIPGDRADEAVRNKRSTPNERPRRRKQLQGAVLRMERHKRNTPAQRPSRMARATQPEIVAQRPLADPAATVDEVTRRASVRALRAAPTFQETPAGGACPTTGTAARSPSQKAGLRAQGSPARAVWRLLAVAAVTVLAAVYWLVWR